MKLNKRLLNINHKRYDVFGAHLLEGAEYDLKSGWDIPFVDTPLDLRMPTHLVPYSKALYDEDKEHAFLHFYQNDHIFDGRFGIWYALVFEKFYKKGFSLNKLLRYSAIITPDYSMYYDMPVIMQMWNLLRSRIVGFYLTKLGFVVVVNVRWTDRRSYSYCFSGIRMNQIVAVSTLGCLRSRDDKKLFISGLEELIIRIRPKTIILYGSLTKEIKNIMDSYNQDYIFFPSEISKVYGENV